MRYNVDFIRCNSIRILCKYGVSEEDSKIVIDTMLEADMCGVSTHGIRMLPSYIKKIEAGQFNLGKIEIIKSTHSFTTVDSNNCIGAASAYRCAEIAVQKAKEHGIHVVFANNCNTYGPAFYYVDFMAKNGLIGITSSNSPAAMPAYNGLEPMLGTNPMAFACPSATCGTIILDMATSIVAKSRFETARVNGERLPEGWALDKDGNPTTDPLEAIKGFVLPMAGFKGYGLAMMIDILSGFISGAGYLNKVGKFYSQTGDCMNVGQLFVAIDPSQIYGENFASDMDDYINTLRNSKAKEGYGIAIPGDNRIEEKRIALSEGIVLNDDSRDKLEELFGCQII